MSKYNWTNDDVRNRLKYLEKLVKTEENLNRKIKMSQDIKNIQLYLDDEQQEERGQIKLLDGYNVSKSILQEIPFTWFDIKEFCEVTEEPLVYIPPLKQTSLTKNDLLSITHDFYKSLNKHYFGLFMKHFYRRNDHIVFKNLRDENPYRGLTLSIATTHESFIEIRRDFTIEDIITTIHEYMHAVSTSINHKHLYYPKNLFSEIDTIFMEIIAAEFLESIFHNGQSILYRASEHEKYVNQADELKAKIELIEYEKSLKRNFKNNKELRSAAESHCELLPEELDDMLTSSILNSQDYLISYMFTLELYKLFLEDKDKALYYLNKIILLDCHSQEEYYCNIKRFGFIPNLSLQEFHKKFTDEGLSLTRRKKK